MPLPAGHGSCPALPACLRCIHQPAFQTSPGCRASQCTYSSLRAKTRRRWQPGWHRSAWRVGLGAVWLMLQQAASWSLSSQEQVSDACHAAHMTSHAGTHGAGAAAATPRPWGSHAPRPAARLCSRAPACGHCGHRCARSQCRSCDACADGVRHAPGPAACLLTAWQSICCWLCTSPAAPDSLPCLLSSLPQAVFGPAEDGGYYLLALSTLPDGLFEVRNKQHIIRQVQRQMVTAVATPLP